MSASSSAYIQHNAQVAARECNLVEATYKFVEGITLQIPSVLRYDGDSAGSRPEAAGMGALCLLALDSPP